MYGAFPINKTYIMDHAYWTFPHNEQGGGAHANIDPTGKKVSLTQNTVGPKAQNMKFKDRVAADGQITFTYNNEPTGSSEWSLVGKMLNTANIIGCRYNNGQIQIVQRHNNGWNDRVTKPFTFVLGMKWDFIVKADGTVQLYINDVLEAETTTAITAAGYWGISTHKITKDYDDIFIDFDVTDVQIFLVDNSGNYLADDAGDYLIEG
jgi:hypothetical protein